MKHGAACAVTISRLMSEIADARVMILYYQNRITRKEIAVQEILESKRVVEEAELPTGAPTLQDEDEDRTCMEMIQLVVPQYKGGEFASGDVFERCLKRFPMHQVKLQNGIYPAIKRLWQAGFLEKCPGGYREKVEAK